jgi:hypothetical protein
MYKVLDGDFSDEVEFLEKFLTEYLGEWDCIEISVYLPESAPMFREPSLNPNTLFCEILENFDDELHEYREFKMTQEQEREIRKAFHAADGTIWLEWRQEDNKTLESTQADVRKN